MDYGENPLGEALQRYLSERYTLDARRAIVQSSEGWSPEIWNDLAELGFLGAFLPESAGGVGATPLELMGLMDAVGRNLVVEPFISSAVIGAAALSEMPNPQNTDAMHKMCRGELRLALAHDEQAFGLNDGHVATTALPSDGGYRLTGRKIVVRDAPAATDLIVSASIGGRDAFSLFLVPVAAAGVSLVGYRLIDGATAADVHLHEVLAPKSSLMLSGTPASALLSRLLNEATAAVCGEAVGVMRAMLDQTVAYVSQRKQFGQPLATFQALQHRLADMFVELEQACSLTHRAFQRRDDDAAVSAAKIRVNQALRVVSHGAVQLHGGIGTTEEIPLGQYFRRAAAIERQYGSSSEHYQRVERRLLKDLEAVSAPAAANSDRRRRSDGHRYSASV